MDNNHCGIWFVTVGALLLAGCGGTSSIDGGTVPPVNEATADVGQSALHSKATVTFFVIDMGKRLKLL